MLAQNTYQNQAQNTKAIRKERGVYSLRQQQKAAMKAYSDAMTAWRLAGKAEADKPQMKDYWRW